MPSPETRLAVLEQIAESHDKRISDMEEFHRDVVDRFDQKIQLDAANQVALERTLSRAVTSIDVLTSAVTNAGSKADEATRLVVKHETIASTLIRVGAALVLVISGGWSVFSFFMKG
jgi:hypothetical protein